MESNKLFFRGSSGGFIFLNPNLVRKNIQFDYCSMFQIQWVETTN